MEGWIKLHRQFVDNDVYRNPNLSRVWIHCLLMANFKESNNWYSVAGNSESIRLNRGQCIYGRKRWSDDLGLPASTVRNAMASLVKRNMICLKPDSQHSVLTVCNYEQYQVNYTYEGQPEDSQRTAKGQTKDTREERKERKERKKLKRATIFADDSDKMLIYSTVLNSFKHLHVVALQ